MVKIPHLYEYTENHSIYFKKVNCLVCELCLIKLYVKERRSETRSASVRGLGGVWSANSGDVPHKEVCLCSVTLGSEASHFVSALEDEKFWDYAVKKFVYFCLTQCSLNFRIFIRATPGNTSLRSECLPWVLGELEPLPSCPDTTMPHACSRRITSAACVWGRLTGKEPTRPSKTRGSFLLYLWDFPPACFSMFLCFILAHASWQSWHLGGHQGSRWLSSSGNQWCGLWSLLLV